MYIKKFTYGGLDWHDCAQHVVQLSCNGEYDVANPKEIIISDILRAYPYLDEKSVRVAIEEGSTYEFVIKTPVIEGENTLYADCESMCIDGSIFYENTGKIEGASLEISESYAWGQISYVTNYELEELEKANLLYLVEEQFLCPTKGVPIVERIYHEPFLELCKAESYKESLQLHANVRSKKELLIFGKEILEKEWYKLNMEAVELMREKKRDIYDPTFSIFVDTHIEKLKALV